MRYIYIILILLAVTGCKEEYTPKPYGYFKIELPDKSYHTITEQLPYKFEIAENAILQPDNSLNAEPYWINILYPQYNAQINISYKTITSDTSLSYFLQDGHRLAYAHTVKAESINEHLFKRENSMFGLLYLIEGNTASSTQFFMTDSLHHFVRGSLYFNLHPNKDSLAPVIEYLRKDIIRLMETLHFKE